MNVGSLSTKLAWISDPHLDHLEKKNREALPRLKNKMDEDGITHVLLGGDIADSRSFDTGLKRLAEVCRRPIYFVLGNHDYYFGSVRDVRERAAVLDIPGVEWLPASGVVEIADGTALVGHGGWGDALCGDLEDFVILTDYAAISDLAATIDREDFWVNGFKKRKGLVSMLQKLGKDAAEILEPLVLSALDSYRNILVLTHVTPFRETCTYKDRPGEDKGFPGFLWDAMGGILKEIASSRPEKRLLVFSGHTHQDSHAQITPNIRAWSARAEYGELHYRIVEQTSRSNTGMQSDWAVGLSEKV